MKKIILTILKSALAAFLALSASACNAKGFSTDQTYDRDYPVPVCDMSFFDSGYAIYGTPTGDGGVIEGYGLTCYVDYGTKTVVPRCSKPNCDHSGGDCAASIECWCLLVYNNSFYRLYEVSEQTSSGDLKLYTAVAMSEMDGTNEKTIAKIEGTVFGQSAAPRESVMFVYDGKLYIYTVLEDFKDGVGSNYRKYKLYGISLGSGQIDDLGLFSEGYSATCLLIGATEEKAYFRCRSREREINSSDYETEEEYFAALEELESIQKFISVSLTDGTTEEFDLPNMTYEHRIYGNCYYYSNSEGFYQLDLLNSTTEKIHDHTCGDLYYQTDDYLFFSCETEGQDYIYDTKDKSVRAVPNCTDNFYFRPFKIKDGYCYGTAQLPEYEHVAVVVYCSEEDYFSNGDIELQMMQYKG